MYKNIEPEEKHSRISNTTTNVNSYQVIPFSCFCKCKNRNIINNNQ